MKTLITDPMLETAMKSAGNGVQRDQRPGFRLTSGSTVEAKVIEAEPNGRIRIDVLGISRTARLQAPLSDQETTRVLGNLVGKSAVFRVLSVRPELVVALEETPKGEKGADPARLPSAEVSKGESTGSPSSPMVARGDRQIQGRLVAMEGAFEPPSDKSPGGYRAVLEVNGKNISAWLDRPASVGNNHLFKIIQTKPGLQVSDQGVIADVSEKPSIHPVHYRNNSLVFAKVLQVGAGDPNSSSPLPAKVEIGGQVVNVLLESPLQEGETHLFRVASGKGLLLLTPVSGSDQSLELLPANLKSLLNVQQAGPNVYGSVIRSLTELGANVPADSPVGKSLQQVLQLIQSLTYGEEQGGKADFFQRFLDLSGYTLEAGAAGKQAGSAEAPTAFQDNLKSLLMKLDGQLTEMLEQGQRGEGRSDLGNLSLNAQGPVRNLLQHILATQIVNTVAFHDQQSLTFEVPFSWAGHMETGRLTVRFKYDDEGGERRDKESPTEIMVVFLLDLENMGPLRVDAYLKKDDRISVTVMAERSEVATYVRNRITELGEGLVDRGFKVESISCLQVHRERIRKETSPDVSSLIETDGMHIVA